ncbi:MAG: T9SS type A sorting domain-containing protein [Candidatus Cloacimonetes bacterium]|nr:T9SS type A sorting domain-containing protein [Candidatus Cloacimonadota bacterium]
MMIRYILIIMLTLFPFLMNGLTHTVKLDGSGDYTTIQGALNASASGDTVLVYPGRYYENVRIQTDSISLISLEAQTNDPAYIDSTVIDGSLMNPCLRVSQGRVNIYIQGFSFTNGLSIGSGGGLSFSSGSNSMFKNSKVFKNIASSGGGVNIIGATTSLSGVSIYSNYSINLGGGVNGTSVTGYYHNITFDPVNRCSIYNNRSGSGQDIYIQNATSNLSVYLDTFSVAVPTSYYAIYLTQNDADYQMSIDIQNAHHQEIDQDIYVSPNGDDANDGLSPESPLRTIHEGIYRIAADSLNQKTVQLLPGTYSRTANDQVFPIALKSWVKVQGSGIDSTVVISEPHPLIPAGYGSADFLFMTYMEPVVGIADMSITTLNTINSCVFHGFKKGSLNLSNVRIHDVTPDYFSAIWAYLSSDYDSVWDNVIIENIVTPDMGLVDIGGSMSGTISNSKFRNATSTYTSASVWAYPLVSFRGDRNLTFENCEFSNLTMLDDNTNAIQVGGVQFPQQNNNFSFNNCLFSNNTSQGGVMNASSKNNPNISFNNCTFAGNESDTYTLMTNGNVNVTNSIFYNDSPYQIKVNPMTGTGETTTMNIDYSCIKDGIAGIQQAAGNTINFLPTSISSNPLFAGGDDIHDPLYYSLSGNSPCINSGTPDISALQLLPYDLAGNWRIWNNRIDMGCYEYGSVPWVDNDDPFIPAVENVISATNYPNPFNPSTTIAFSLPVAGIATLEIYNLKGQKVRQLLNSTLPSGSHKAVWDGINDLGNPVSSGIYFYRVNCNKQAFTGKMILAK